MSSSRLGGFLPDRRVTHCHAIAGPLSLIRWSAPKAEAFLAACNQARWCGIGRAWFQSGQWTTRAAAVIHQIAKGRARMEGVAGYHVKHGGEFHVLHNVRADQAVVMGAWRGGAEYAWLRGLAAFGNGNGRQAVPVQSAVKSFVLRMHASFFSACSFRCAMGRHGSWVPPGRYLLFAGCPENRKNDLRAFSFQRVNPRVARNLCC